MWMASAAEGSVPPPPLRDLQDCLHMLREASASDMDDIRRWRNHPQVRALSFTTHVIGEEEHRRWWERVSADDDHRVYVYERSGQPAGVVTLELEPEGSATWGFYLDIDGLEARGELLPAWLEVERDVLTLAFDELGLARLHGEMLADNAAVRQLHRRYGFQETDTYEREIDGTLHEIVHIEVTPDTVRRRRGTPS